MLGGPSASLLRPHGVCTSIAADARALLESFREHANFEARERVRGRCIDGAATSYCSSRALS